MSASTPLLTDKHRHRALQLLIAVPLLALGIAAGAGTAYASSPTFTPAEVHLSNGYCSVSGWPNGEIFCGTSKGANLPDGTQEIFGIGLDDAVWTDWGTEAHPSSWKSLGAPSNGCNAGHGRLDLTNYGDYNLAVGCWDFNGNETIDVRIDGPNGTWLGW